MIKGHRWVLEWNANSLSGCLFRAYDVAFIQKRASEALSLLHWRCCMLVQPFWRAMWLCFSKKTVKCALSVRAISIPEIQAKEKLEMWAKISLKGYLLQHCCHSKNIKVIHIPTIEDWLNTLRHKCAVASFAAFGAAAWKCIYRSGKMFTPIKSLSKDEVYIKISDCYANTSSKPIPWPTLTLVPNMFSHEDAEYRACIKRFHFS